MLLSKAAGSNSPSASHNLRSTSLITADDNACQRRQSVQGIVKHTVGLKLGKYLSDATKAVDSKLYPPRKAQRKRKRGEGADINADDDPHLDADKAANDAELDNLLEASMADMQSEEEDAGQTQVLCMHCKARRCRAKISPVRGLVVIAAPAGCAW